MCETNLDDSIDSGNVSVRGYLPLIRKDSSTYIHGLAVYVKEGLPFARDLSLENSADSYLCFRLVLLHSVSYFFFLYRSPSSALCTVFYSISSNIDEALSINSSANVFVFGDFNIDHKDWLTYFSGTDRPGELCYNFSISNDLTQMVDFPTRIPDCGSHSPALLDLFLSSDASICSTMAFPPLPLGNSDHVVVTVSIDFPTNSQQDAPFHCIAYDYSRADWDGLRDHLRDVPWEDIFKLGASAAASEFCEWIQVGIDVYIPHRKYQVKSHSSPWFSAAKLGSRDFWQIANSVLNKGKSAMPPLFNGPEVLSSASDKAKLFAENFSLNSNLDDLGVSLPVFPSKTNLKLHNISITPKMVRKVVMNLDLSKASGPDCIPVVVLKNCEPELSYMLAELFNKCLKESCFPDCWKVSSVVPVFKNVGERSTAKNYRPVSLLSVVSKVFEKLVNNGIVDHLEKCGLFSDFQYGFRSSRSTADLLTVVSDTIAGATGMLVFFTNLSLREFQVRYSALFLLFSVIDNFKWFWMESLHKNIQLMREFLKAPFLVLHFSHYTLMTFLMMLSVILLSMLMILLSILSVIGLLICGNNLNWLLNLNMIYETRWTGVRSGLLISMLGKLSWFRLTGLITMVLLM